jgi:hypothetical protein
MGVQESHPASVAAWRQRIVSGASDYGLPLLADAAPPLFDFLDARREREKQGASA